MGGSSGGIDFHDARNRRTYSGRVADISWRVAMRELVDAEGADVVDVGCGGGIYTRAWHDLGAATVTGVDFSWPILDAGRESHGDLPGVTFRLGDAVATGLPDRCADVVFERALVHHLTDLRAAAGEAARLLRTGGTLLVQDRTPEDVAQPGSVGHPRGWPFEVFPHLLGVEQQRRPAAPVLADVLIDVGLGPVDTTSLWEVRRRYDDREDYLVERGQRTGRSILHELSDAELRHLVEQLRRRLPRGPVVERDRWTLWRARPPGP